MEPIIGRTSAFLNTSHPANIQQSTYLTVHFVYCDIPRQEHAMKITLPESAPVAAVKPHRCEAHGVEWIDDYAWLRAENWQQAMREPTSLPTSIAEYLQAENRHFDAAMQETHSLQQQLIAEMRGRIEEKEVSLPDKDGDYNYQYQYEEGAEHPVYLRTYRGSSQQQVLLDINIEAQAHDYFDHDLVEHNTNHKLLAWTCDTTGAEYFELFIRDLQTGKDLNYSIADVDTATWATSDILYYTRVDKNHRPNKVFIHQIGTNPADDILAFEETDDRFCVEVSTSMSREYVFISTGMNDQDEVWFVPVATPHAAPQVIEPRTDTLEYEVEHRHDHFVILTNADQSTDFKTSHHAGHPPITFALDRSGSAPARHHDPRI